MEYREWIRTQAKLKEIDDYFDSSSIEKFEEVLIRNGMKPEKRIGLFKKILINIRNLLELRWN